jgi:hypothetical protein
MSLQQIAQLGRLAAMEKVAAPFSKQQSGKYLPEPTQAMFKKLNPRQVAKFQSGVYSNPEGSRFSSLNALAQQATPSYAQDLNSPVAHTMTARRYGGQVPTAKAYPAAGLGFGRRGIPGTRGVDERGNTTYARYGTLGMVRPEDGKKEMYMSPNEDIQKMLNSPTSGYSEYKIPTTYLSRAGIINHEGEHKFNQPYVPRFPNNPEALNARAVSETAPAIGDIVFGGEKFRQEEGRDPQHTVQFPGGKEHDINWMINQAKEHGYFKGRSMHDLIFNTQAGRQWYKQNIENMQRMEQAGTNTSHTTGQRPFDGQALYEKAMQAQRGKQ